MGDKYPTMIKVDIDDKTAPWNTSYDLWRKYVRVAYKSTEGDTSDGRFVPDFWLIKMQFDYLLSDGSVGASELVWTYKHRISASYSPHFSTKREALEHIERGNRSYYSPPNINEQKRSL